MTVSFLFGHNIYVLVFGDEGQILINLLGFGSNLADAGNKQH